MAAATITDRAIVLSRESWRESDKRIVFYLQNHGKISAVAVGARKILSKLSGHLEPLREVDVMLAAGKQTYKIAQAVTVQSFIPSAPMDLQTMTMLGTLARLVMRATEEAHADAAVYEMLRAGMEEVSATRGSEIIFGTHLFLLAEHFGYAPEFNRCVACGRSEDLKFFSPSHGGVVCATCRVDGQLLPYDPHSSKFYRYLSDFLRWRGLV